MVCQSWALDGYGTPPIVFIAYLLKIAAYIYGWTLVMGVRGYPLEGDRSMVVVCRSVPNCRDLDSVVRDTWVGMRKWAADRAIHAPVWRFPVLLAAGNSEDASAARAADRWSRHPIVARCDRVSGSPRQLGRSVVPGVECPSRRLIAACTGDPGQDSIPGISTRSLSHRLERVLVLRLAAGQQAHLGSHLVVGGNLQAEQTLPIRRDRDAEQQSARASLVSEADVSGVPR